MAKPSAERPHAWTTRSRESPACAAEEQKQNIAALARGRDSFSKKRASE
jgi:hypothetical protein